MKLITIIIPLFNSEKYVINTLNSLRNQTYKIWECIVIDDDSEDHSYEIVKQIVDTEPRIRLVKRKNYSTKKGANTCRNIGLSLAKTLYIMFIDADDHLEPFCLEERINIILKNKTFDFYIFRTGFIDQKDNIIGDFRNETDNFMEIIINFIGHKIPWHTMSLVWEIQFLLRLGGWNEEYERLQDVELNIRALLKKPKVYFSQISVDSYYRIYAISLQKQRASQKAFCRLINDFYHPLISDKSITYPLKSKLVDIFQEQMNFLLRNYLVDIDYIDREFEYLYLKVIKNIGLDVGEKKFVKQLFIKFK
ncbi:MAG: glycosyltransferase family 2 protein [Sphingobacterium sp.]|jgi:glycosyltransferase involved in cell wall biosynthesis|nr:glycosyltransferase family 2 protein [Sphingobacterium sp.]